MSLSLPHSHCLEQRLDNVQISSVLTYINGLAFVKIALIALEIQFCVIEI